jgi:hypothetical protein
LQVVRGPRDVADQGGDATPRVVGAAQGSFDVADDPSCVAAEGLAEQIVTGVEVVLKHAHGGVGLAGHVAQPHSVGPVAGHEPQGDRQDVLAPLADFFVGERWSADPSRCWRHRVPSG